MSKRFVERPPSKNTSHARRSQSIHQRRNIQAGVATGIVRKTKTHNTTKKRKPKTSSNKKNTTQARRTQYINERRGIPRAIPKTIKKQISSFLEKPDSVKIRSYLNTVCPNSGQCVVFGVGTEKLRKYFQDYSWSLVDKDAVKKIGASSNNGFVFEVPFVRDNYTVYAVLKNAKDKDSDNLFYEALVGLYVNKKNYIFPCFLETYGLYQWPDTSPDFHNRAYQFSKGNANMKRLVELDKLVPKKLSYDAFFHDPTFIYSTCKNAQFGSVLIQHIHNARSLHSYMKDLRGSQAFLTFHLVQYLYQVYAPLGMLSDEFTHYDLHTDNVILYTVGSEQSGQISNSSNSSNSSGGVPHHGKFITMKYHYPNGDVVTFNTFDIVKILDYGRCYFKQSDQINSQTYYETLTKSITKFRGTGQCANDSYSILEDEDPEGSFHYICSNKRNKSHDLRLAAMIWHTPGKYKGTERTEDNGLRTILASMFYEDTYLVNKKGKPDNQHGTQEVTEQSYNGLSKLQEETSIRNVEDMHWALKDLIMTTPHFRAMNQTLFQGHTKIGEMNVWLDGSRSLQYTVEH